MYLVHSQRIKHRVVQKTIKYIGKKRHVPKKEFDCMKRSYQDRDWILDGYSDLLSYKEHEEMQKLSDSYKRYLKSLDKVTAKKEEKRFLSAFIADSNAIEGSTITPEETYNLLFEDIVPGGSSQKEIRMATNMMEAWQYLEKNQNRMPGEKEICILHRSVNKDIEEDRTLGKYKNVQNYVGDTLTSSHLFVTEKMERLLRWISKAFKKMDSYEVAFQSHAQFELIHPFVDGNGRVGRLLLSWLLMNKRLMPLAIQNRKRPEYLSALKNAQRGKVEAICRFCYESYVDQYKSMA